MDRTPKILVVDDDVEFVESNKDLLEAHGFEVVTAHDGRSGFEAACRERPDLMILDVMMATATEGFEIARQIRDEPSLKGLRVLLVTGVSKAMDLPFRLEPNDTWLPVNRVLEKPILPRQLIAEVEKALQTPPLPERNTP
jgi:CheY-like chemotaxis protein